MMTTSKNELRGSQTERTTSKHGVPDCVPSRGLPSRGLSSRSSGRRCNISVHDWSETASGVARKVDLRVSHTGTYAITGT